MSPSIRLSAVLEKLRGNGALSDPQAAVLNRLHAGTPFSLYWELRALLYLGVVFFLTGIGLTIKDHFAQIGHVAIIGSLTLVCLGLLLYCFWKAPPYSSGEVASPHLAFDYALYLACTLYSIDVGYVETHFHVLGAYWKNYLLFSTGIFFILAYRFDNRLVLSLALGTLAAWFGFKLSGFHFDSPNHFRLSAIIYGAVVGLAGVGLQQKKIKAHFLNVYLNFAAHFAFVAVVAGAIQYRLFSFYFLALVILCVGAAIYALRCRRFLYLAYAVVYGYAGLSGVMGDLLRRHPTIETLYYIISSIAVVGALVGLSKLFKDET